MNKWIEKSYLSHSGSQFGSVQSLSRVPIFATPWIAACQASLSITNSRSSLRLTSIESVMPSSHLILCRPLLLLPPIPPSIRVFSNEWIQTRAIWNKSLCLNYATLSLKVKIKIQYIRPNWRMSAKLDHPMGIQTARNTGQTEGMEWRLLEWRGRASGFSSKLSAWVRKAEA